MTDNTNTEENMNTTPSWRKLPGPWQDEASEASWYNHGLRCYITRPVPEMGHWCGYVDIPKGHPWFGMSYDDIDDKLVTIDVHIHGGLTYADDAQGYWRVGFDCAQAGDMVPGLDWQRDSDYIYRTQEWVINQTEKLAAGISSGFEDTLTGDPDADRWPKGEEPSPIPHISKRDADTIREAQDRVDTLRITVNRKRKHVWSLSAALSLDEVPYGLRSGLLDMLEDMTDELKDDESALNYAETQLRLVTPY